MNHLPKNRVHSTSSDLTATASCAHEPDSESAAVTPNRRCVETLSTEAGSLRGGVLPYWRCNIHPFNHVCHLWAH